MYRASVLLGVAAAACGPQKARNSGPESPVPPPAAPAPSAGCADAVLVADNGVETTACESTLPKGLTILDLRDAWTPRLFAPAADGTAPEFRATYLALAAEQATDGTRLPPSAGYTELYGVVPSLAIVRERLAQTARYACHAKVDSAPLANLTRPYGQEQAGTFKVALLARKQAQAILERVRVQRQLADYTPLATDKELGPTYARWKDANDLVSGVESAQRHLVCEGYLADKDIDGSFSWATGNALELFERRNFLIPNSRLDPDTRAALATDPRELDFSLALRILRERVVDTTGLIEDGTAGAGPQPVLGRMLDSETMRSARHGKPLKHGAPDLIAAATEAAARELGWTSPAAAEAWLAKHPGGARVALALPAAPAYHTARMQLSAEIDRGDVWYDETPTPRVAWNRPSLTLYVQDGATKRALVRWPTTIGGWSDVSVGGKIIKRWKESDVGPRQWRELYAAPTWLPPDTTPDLDLVKWVGRGKWELKRSIMGPGPMAAFGMMLLPHEAVIKANGRTQLVTNGIGTHGSAVVTSILTGTSHGCHRLYNQLAVRLGSFLLAHREHVVRGQQPEHYRRLVQVGKSFPVRIDTRGFLYELTPPVPINVLAGNIRSERKAPPADALPAAAD